MGIETCSPVGWEGLMNVKVNLDIRKKYKDRIMKQQPKAIRDNRKEQALEREPGW